MANLASTWLLENGTGSLRGKDQQQLRQNLLKDLDRILGLSNARPAVVEEEVDQFLASGRVSEANLKRLLCRAEARLIIAGARSDAGYSAVTAGSLSQRDPPKPVAPAQVPPAAPAPASARMPQRDDRVSAEEQLLKWSQVAKLAQKEVELEALQKREAKKNAQTEIRTYLQQQIDEKNSKKQRAAEAEKKFCEMQDAELERWKRDQVQKAEERLHKVQQVVRDREAQAEEVFKRREAEREKKLDEDKCLVQRATREMELEQQAVAEKRHQSRLAQAAWILEANQNKRKGHEARQIRIAEEQRILQDYAELMEKQEARRRAAKPKIREQSPEAHPRVKRKGEELYYDEAIVRRIHEETLAKAEQVELRKQERLKRERHQNQAFLSQQIAERNQQKRSVLEQKGGQKNAAQQAADEARQTEKRRAQERRARYLQNRLELEGQMSSKSKHKLQEDEMSRAEKAINRRYVIETFHKTSEGLSPREEGISTVKRAEGQRDPHKSGGKA